MTKQLGGAVAEGEDFRFLADPQKRSQAGIFHGARS